MKEKIKAFCKGYWKLVIGVTALVVIMTGILTITDLGTKKNLMDTVAEVENGEMLSEEDSQLVEGLRVEETSNPEETKSPEETRNPGVMRSKKTNLEEDSLQVVKPTEKATTQSEPTATEVPITEVPITEAKYVPISEGWKAETSAKGDITFAQKEDLDSMIQTWKAGELTDLELKDEIINYLDEQKIKYMEVSVTSKGYTLVDCVPEIDLRDGGNLYSYVGTYSTGEQNPDGTNKTVFYNWTTFVF